MRLWLFHKLVADYFGSGHSCFACGPLVHYSHVVAAKEKSLRCPKIAIRTVHQLRDLEHTVPQEGRSCHGRSLVAIRGWTVSHIIRIRVG